MQSNQQNAQMLPNSRIITNYYKLLQTRHF